MTKETTSMSQNETGPGDFFEKYKKFLEKLAMTKYEVDAIYKYRDFYGKWGMTCVRYINPYLWVIPLIAAILLVVTFKKQQLFGQMQKCLILIMTIDVFFATITGLKDAVFNFMIWNYGFVEFKLCMFMLLFIRFQTAVHGTSLWIKTFMLLHRVFMIMFPFKFRQVKFRLFFIPFFSLHILLVIFYCALVYKNPLRSFPTIQEYTSGMQLKKIDACVLDPRMAILDAPFYIFVQYFSFFAQTVYLTLLPICIYFICIVFLIVLVRKEITRMSHLAPASSLKVLRNVKYLILMKVHIYLGISLFLQETPILVSTFLGTFGQSITGIKNASSVVLIFMFQTFAIGKPMDLLIYASLSQKVKTALLNIICCRNKKNKV